MSELIRRAQAGALGGSTLDRQTSRAVQRIHAGMFLERAADHARTQLARQRVQDIEGLTQQSLMAATEIAMVEQFCADRAPHASGRLSFIANVGTAAIGQTLLEFGQGR